jgi:hypothetical protein
MVLRKAEADRMVTHDEFAAHYKPVKVFDVSDRVNSYSFLPGKGYLAYDTTFTVYRRN